jgi:KDO2-lipid IV(A) lauroyltransferase
VRASYRHVLASVVEDRHIDDVLLRHPDPLALCDASEFEPVREVVTAGRGLLLATLHLGDWEAMAALCPRIGMHPFYVVSRPPRNRALSVDFQRRREARGYRLIPRHGAIQAIPRIVAAGGTVALMLDQRARGKTVVAPLFGRPANCERSIAVLARRLRVPIVVGAGVGLPGGRYRLLFPRVLQADEVARMGPEQVMTEINRGFERMILEYPEQYLWLHDRYRKAPIASDPGGPGGDDDPAAEAGAEASASDPQGPR